MIINNIKINNYLKRNNVYIRFVNEIHNKYLGQYYCWTDQVVIYNRSRKYRTKTQTVLHELIHSTGHESRLNRKSLYSYNDMNYYIEEMIAEIVSYLILFNKPNPRFYQVSIYYYLKDNKLNKNDYNYIIKESIKAYNYFTNTNDGSRMFNLNFTRKLNLKKF